MERCNCTPDENTCRDSGARLPEQTACRNNECLGLCCEGLRKQDSESTLELKQQIKQLRTSLGIVDGIILQQRDHIHVLDRKLEGHHVLHKDHYANHEQSKKELQLVVQEQDSQCEQMSIINDTFEAMKGLYTNNELIDEHDKRIEKLEQEKIMYKSTTMDRVHERLKELESEKLCNEIFRKAIDKTLCKHDGYFEGLDGRIDALDKNFKDTWMQNLPVKTYDMLSRIEKLESYFSQGWLLPDVHAAKFNLVVRKEHEGDYFDLSAMCEKLDELKMTMHQKCNPADSGAIGANPAEHALDPVGYLGGCYPIFPCESKTKGLTFAEAIEAMKNGKSVKFGDYIYSSENFENGGEVLNWEDLVGTDWEIVT